MFSLARPVVLPALLAALVAALPAAADKKNWPQWRGPLGTGVAPEGDPPEEWSETENVRWKLELPGKGHSTPIVWGDRVFVTAAVAVGEEMEPKYSGAPGAHDNVPVTHQHEFIVLAASRRDGKMLWKKSVCQVLPREGGHYTGSLASNSPVTDGQHLFAFFGSRGLYCLDFDGELKWKVDFGDMQTKHGHGEGSSPVLYGDTLVVNWDHEGKSFVAALDKKTGKELWKRDREEVTSWATPIVVEHDGRPQLVISGTERVRSYDLATGKVIWECGGLSANVVASPVAGNGMVFAASSYDTRNLLAIRLDGAQGDISDTEQVAWSTRRATPYVPSPLLYGDSLYFLSHYQNVLSRLAAKTGEEPTGPFRLDYLRNVYASPVAADGRIYITDLDGRTLVITNDEVPRAVALNQLDDSFSASAAIAGGEFYLRGAKHLYCIAED